MNESKMSFAEWVEQEMFRQERYDPGPEVVLEALEVAVGGGELTVEEAVAFYDAYISYLSKDKLMVTKAINVGLPQILFDGNRDKEERIFNHKILVNALTGAMVSAVVLHIAQVQRGVAQTTDMANEVTPGEPGEIPSLHGEPTLDQRNAIDDDIEGLETTAANNDELGFVTPEPPLQIAEKCDALRVHFYHELDTLLAAEGPSRKQLLPLQYLVREKKVPKEEAITTPINWDQPMSAEMYLRFRVQLAGTVPENRVAALAKQHGEDGDYIRKILTANAVRDAARLQKLTPEILTIVDGFTKAGDDAMFDTLPLQTQLAVARRVAGYLDREYARMITALMRTTSLDVTTTLEGRKLIMKRNWEEVKKWVSDKEATLAV